MPKEAPIYHRLPGRGAGFGETSRLYLADDHLLLVTATGFTENYRRFYLRDIQAITARKTVTGAVTNGIVGFILFWMVVGLLNASSWFELFVWSAVVGFFFVLLLVNILLGPTCLCEIHTAVQSRRLGSVNRLRTARKLLARLRPVLEAAQGAVPVEELRQRVDQARQQGFVTDAPPVIR